MYFFPIKVLILLLNFFVKIQGVHNYYIKTFPDRFNCKFIVINISFEP